MPGCAAKPTALLAGVDCMSFLLLNKASDSTVVNAIISGSERQAGEEKKRSKSVK